MDPGLEEAAFRDWCGNAFLRIQAAWVHRDVESLRPLLGEQMHEAFREQIEELRAKGLLNRLERIVVRAIELTEAWQELGLDPITVHYLASLLDYTVEETSGRIVEGDDRSPVTFDEFWTLTRPVGPNPSRLSAIHQIEWLPSCSGRLSDLAYWRGSGTTGSSCGPSGNSREGSCVLPGHGSSTTNPAGGTGTGETSPSNADPCNRRSQEARASLHLGRGSEASWRAPRVRNRPASWTVFDRAGDAI
jgi:hypothetical protein